MTEKAKPKVEWLRLRHTHGHHWKPEPDDERLFHCDECGAYALRRVYFRVICRDEEADKHGKDSQLQRL